MLGFKCDLKSVLLHPVFIVTLIFIFLIIGLSITGEYINSSVSDFLEFDHEKIAAGEVWRVYTGSLVHYGLYHAVMNVCSVAMIGLFLFWFFPVKIWLFVILVIPLMDGLGLYFFSHDIEIYRGYSGAVYGLAIVGLVLNWSINPVINSGIILALFGKLIYEQLPGFNTLHMVDKIGVPVAIDAHLWGGISGVIVSVPLWFLLGTYRQSEVKV